jgi:hypothetical protein
MLWGLYTIATAFTLAWLALAAWALLADRSRGRRRCPKCFFSLEGLDTLRCPECGRIAKSERHLHRTRRRWGVAVLGGVLLLSPAAATAWLARVQQVGAWADVPTGVLTRLLWTGDARIADEAIARIERYEVSWPDADRIARAAVADLGTETRRERGYMLLGVLATNSYANSADDRRPMLEELSPDRTVPALLHRFEVGDAEERAQVMGLYTHLRDVDERVNLLIVSHLADPNERLARVAEWALRNDWRPSKSVERLPPPPEILFDRSRQLRQPEPYDTEDLAWFSARVAACGFDTDAVLDLARPVATGALRAPTPGSDGMLPRAAALWLWCRLAPEEPACLAAVEAAAASEAPGLRVTAIEQLPVFPWSDRVEGVLRLGLADPDPASGVQFNTTQVIQRFGPDAAPLIPDMLAYVRRPGRGCSSALPEEFMAAGGKPEDLLAAIVEHLEAVREQLEPRAQGAKPVFYGFDFTWLADLGLRHADAAETVRWYLDNRVDEYCMSSNDIPNAALAYAVLTGEREYPTRVALGRTPDFTDGFGIASWSEVLLELCRRDLADPELVIDQLVTHGDATQRDGFLKIMKWCPREHLAHYKPALEQLASDEDPAIAAAAAKQLKRLK